MAFNSRTESLLACFKNFGCLFDARQVAGDRSSRSTGCSSSFFLRQDI